MAAAVPQVTRIPICPQCGHLRERPKREKRWRKCQSCGLKLCEMCRQQGDGYCRECGEE